VICRLSRGNLLSRLLFKGLASMDGRRSVRLIPLIVCNYSNFVIRKFACFGNWYNSSRAIRQHWDQWVFRNSCPWSLSCGLIDGKILEVVYINIVENWMHGPRLMSKKGRVIWTGVCPAFTRERQLTHDDLGIYSPYFLLLGFG